MADDKTPKEPGGLTEKADGNKERVSEVSNVSRTINQMQKKVDQELAETGLNTTDYDQIKEVQNSMIKVLGTLSHTVSQIGRGFTKVAKETAAASKDSIKQYGNAIGKEINYDKKNTVAMALAKTSPLMGYFVAKFMETDIWKAATDRMKENAGKALGSVGHGLKSLLTGGKNFKRDKAGKGNTSAKLTKLSREKIPKMHSGGYVEKGGLARLHAAEVVMPVDKLLSKMDEQVSVQRTLARQSVLIQSRSMAKMGTYVGDLNNPQKSGLVKGFFKALSDVQSQYEEPSEKRMLRSLLAIQEAIGAQVGTMTQVWQKMLIEHPVFRNLLYIGKLLKRTLGKTFSPIYAFFKTRGGYASHLSKSKQPFHAVAENVGVLYTGTMYRLDAVAMYTRATAEATRDMSTMFTGRKYKKMEGITTGKWSWLSFSRGILNSMTKGFIKYGGKWFGGGIFKKGLQDKYDKKSERWSKKRLFREQDYGTGVGGLFKRGGYSSQQEEIYGSQQEIIANIAKDLWPEEIKKFVLAEKAIPVSVVNYAGKAAETAEENQEVMQQVVNGLAFADDKLEVAKKERKKSDKTDNKNILKFRKSSKKISEKNLEANAEVNAREKRKSMFGITKWISKIAMLLPFLLSKFGLGKWAMKLLGGGLIKRLLTRNLFSSRSIFGKKIGGWLKNVTGRWGGKADVAGKEIFKKQVGKKAGKSAYSTAEKARKAKGAKRLGREKIARSELRKAKIDGGLKTKRDLAKKAYDKAEKKAWKKNDKLAKKALKKSDKLAAKALKKGTRKAALKLGAKAVGRVALRALGPIAMAAGAFEAGWYLGKVLDKTLGISEKFIAMQDKTDKRATALANEVSKLQKTNLDKAKAGGEEGYESKRQLDMDASLGSAQWDTREQSWLHWGTGGLLGERYTETHTRDESLGVFGRRNSTAINAAQQLYMHEHQGEYLAFHPNVVEHARSAWLKSGGYGSKWIGTDPEKYGKKREAHFLKFLQSKYKPMSAEQYAKENIKYQKHTETTHGVKISDQQMRDLEEGEKSPYQIGIEAANKENLGLKRQKEREKKAKKEKRNKDITEKYNKGKQVITEKIDEVAKVSNELIESLETERKVTYGKQVVKEKFEEVKKSAEQLAEEAKTKTLAQSAIIKTELEKQTKSAMENTKDLRGSVEQGLIQTSNNISSSVQTINNTMNGPSSTPSLTDHAQAVINGTVE